MDSGEGGPSPATGDYLEKLHGLRHLTGLAAGEERWLTIPSDYRVHLDPSVRILSRKQREKEYPD